MRLKQSVVGWATLLVWIAPVFCFTCTPLQRPPTLRRRVPQRASTADKHDGSIDHNDNNNMENTTWNPQLRKILGSLASVGVLETTYLTYSHLTQQSVVCLADTNECQSVLNGPYSELPGTNVPLASLGLCAYTLVAGLALFPLANATTPTASKETDAINRVLLTALCTTMGVFSAFLVSLLLGVLHQSCPYCFLSAGLSTTLALTCWVGGAIPTSRRMDTVWSSLGGAALSLGTALTLFLSIDLPPASALSSPPPITTDSSVDALQVARDLERLDTHFYGAFWCSHCFEQKQTMGKQAMELIPYVECSRDGENSQSQLCKEKQIPGYPTWEIAGTLYPGEQALSELREIVEKAQSRTTSNR